MSNTVKIAAEKLKKDGYDGLYSPGGECGCTLDDFAPCGECEEVGNYINGCEPGYQFRDPKDPFFWIVKNGKNEPTDDDWEMWRSEYA